MGQPDVTALTTPRRVPRPLVVLAWVVVVGVAVLLLTGAVMVVAALEQRRAPHAVLDARLSTSTFLAGSEIERTSLELWTDPTVAVARLRVGSTDVDLYYVRDASGIWYAIGRAGTREPWRRTRLHAAQAPSLLPEDGIRGSFARLRARVAAGGVIPVDLHHHLAYAFATAAVAWPYPSGGPTMVWLDGVTGLPLQYRIRSESGKQRIFTITVVDSIRTIASTSLPSDFFAPPDRPPAAWEDVIQRIAQWINERVGSGQWAVGSGQWAVGSGQWAVGSGQSAVGSNRYYPCRAPHP